MNIAIFNYRCAFLPWHLHRNQKSLSSVTPTYSYTIYVLCHLPVSPFVRLKIDGTDSCVRIPFSKWRLQTRELCVILPWGVPLFTTFATHLRASLGVLHGKRCREGRSSIGLELGLKEQFSTMHWDAMESQTRRATKSNRWLVDFLRGATRDETVSLHIVWT